MASSAACMARRKARTFCFVIACIACLNVPLGTALGVCTILVLSRPRVKDLFAGRIIERPDPDDEEDDLYDRYDRKERDEGDERDDRDDPDERPRRSSARQDDDHFTSR
jgi:hypothetical protein